MVVMLVFRCLIKAVIQSLNVGKWTSSERGGGLSFCLSGFSSPALPLTCKCLDSWVSSVSHKVSSPGIFWGREGSVSLDWWQFARKSQLVVRDCRLRLSGRTGLRTSSSITCKQQLSQAYSCAPLGLWSCQTHLHEVGRWWWFTWGSSASPDAQLRTPRKSHPPNEDPFVQAGLEAREHTAVG